MKKLVIWLGMHQNCHTHEVCLPVEYPCQYLNRILTVNYWRNFLHGSRLPKVSGNLKNHHTFRLKMNLRTSYNDQRANNAQVMGNLDII